MRPVSGTIEVEGGASPMYLLGFAPPGKIIQHGNWVLQEPSMSVFFDTTPADD
jgi:hypothetical protein